MTTFAPLPAALDAYETLARDYDSFTSGYAHAKWFASVHARALQIPIPGRRALDLACGTGKSTTPLIGAGYDVQACDISPQMIEVARDHHCDQADAFFVADMCALPEIAPVDFVTCFDDSVNYLTSLTELEAAFSCVADVLVSGGVFVFDTNTLATYRTAFAQTLVRREDDRLFVWEGQGNEEMAAGEVALAQLEAFVAGPDGTWSRRTSIHAQRHHPSFEVQDALANAGLECISIVGQSRGAHLEDNADEERHIKLVYFARRA